MLSLLGVLLEHLYWKKSNQFLGVLNNSLICPETNDFALLACPGNRNLPFSAFELHVTQFGHVSILIDRYVLKLKTCEV